MKTKENTVIISTMTHIKNKNKGYNPDHDLYLDRDSHDMFEHDSFSEKDNIKWESISSFLIFLKSIIKK